MSRHTPKPWKFVGDGLFGGVYLDKGVERYTYQVFPFFDEDRRQGQHGQRHEADKQLVEAAPDLLEAAQLASECILDYVEKHGASAKTIQCLRSLDAAVGKAQRNAT